ncbi:hypothetical protein HPB47_018133 [Ixodes persulcatus]|uniref:Uncharacterized protein n=1 Tax=Ixodes persulcatus TaxID=34615 RepID=A0AC60QLJ2_IXOPE|nr:hypothetical protein HPB47_018133 [Ixodes persulcatus]
MANTRLTWYLENNRILAPTQIGFRAGLSTQDALPQLKRAVLDPHSTQPRAVVGVDIKKAFDGKAEKNMYSLSIGDQPITRKSIIRKLGLNLDENCTANTWFQKNDKIKKKILRTSFDESQHAPAMLALDRLINEARRLITVPPRYTRLDALKSCGGINDLSELVSTFYNIQEARLRTTPAGRSGPGVKESLTPFTGRPKVTSGARNSGASESSSEAASLETVHVELKERKMTSFPNW